MGRAAAVPAHYSLPPVICECAENAVLSPLDGNGREVGAPSLLFPLGENPGLEAEVLWVVDTASKDPESLN